ncbi:MAG TPA: hypothetical protein VIB11_01160 [Pedococcus sp.]|jgi:uncharacterized protein YcbX|uniref:hypothetical protein n=1 Tax=Pedococcus sp. TaxID=2860345 RepID=UPI002F924D83
MSAALLTEIHIYPVKGEAGQELPVADIEPDGVAGDRRKRAPVQVIAAQDVTPETRANLVVTLAPGELTDAIGAVLRVGEVELDVTSVPRGCPGVYAAVRTPGRVSVGDPVEVSG